MSVNGEITAVRISRKSSLSGSMEDILDYEREKFEEERRSRPPSGRQRPKSGRPSSKERSPEQVMRADSDQIDLDKLLHSMLDINDNKSRNILPRREDKRRPFSAHPSPKYDDGQDSIVSDGSFSRPRTRLRPFSAHTEQERANYSFSNSKVDQIDRENQRLLKALMNQQEKNKQPVLMKKAVPFKVQSSATLNRFRQQQQIERENMNVSKIQRKVLTAEGGPPLFVPFEDSDFAKRKPQGPSVTIKHVESFKQKGKPPAKQTETSSKPFDEKKIWKSEPKKDKITKPYKDGGSNERERPENRKQTPQTEAKPSKSRETDRVVNKKNYDGREQRGGVKDFKDSKDSSYNKQHSKGTKREEEKGKGRNAEREEKRGSVDYSNNSRYVKPDAKATGGKENSNGAKFGGREGYDSRPGQKQRGNFPHERSENFNRKSARHEENSHLSKNSLPPRLERLKQLKVDNAEEYNQQDFKKEKKPSDLAGTEKDARAKNHVEDDMKRVTDLLNERMKIDEKKMDNDRNRGQRDNSFRDRNYRKSDFNPNQSRRDNNRERNMYGGGRGRIGTEERQKEQRIQEGRGRGRQYGPDERERRNPQRSSGGREVGYQERSYQVQERVAVDSQERGGFTGRGRRYDGGQARHGGRGQTGPRSFNPRESPEESKLENDRDKMPTQQVKDDVMQQTDRRILNPPPHETKEMDLQENRPNSSKYKNDIGVPIESEIQLTEDTDKPDKFKEFLNSVIHNNCVGGDYRLMQQQILSDSNIPQTSMQQPMITPSGQLMYNYMPSYPTAMYHPNIQQGYQNVANQEFQQPGGYQSGIHSMQQISQYQQPVVSTLAQEYRYMPTLAPQSMRFQSQGMQPGGQQTRPRPRVRHDVYRPKHN